MVHEVELDAWSRDVQQRLQRHYGARISQQPTVAVRVREAAREDLAGRLRTLEQALRTPAGRYVPGVQIDRGGMGRVCLAHDRVLERSVAYKQAADSGEEGAGGGSRRGDVEHQQLRLLAESEVIAGLQHPGIVPIHDVGIDPDGAPFFVMPRIEGESLAIASRDWPLARRVETLRRVCETMAYAHARGVVHRDLKPQNVMIGAFGEVYVVDWGLARRAESGSGAGSESGESALGADSADASPGLTVAGSVLGTPAYMAPERVSGESLDSGQLVAGDVYSAGAMLYELLTGETPYGGERSDWSLDELLAAIRERAPRPISGRGIPRELIAICERAMHREAAARYPGMSEVAADLRAWSELRVVEAYGGRTKQRLRKFIQRNRGSVAVLAAATVILVATTVQFVVHLSSARDSAVANLQEVLDLAVVQRIEDLRGRADDELWPAERARIPAMQAWLREAESLRPHLDRLRERRREVVTPARPAEPESTWRARLLGDAIAALELIFSDLDASAPPLPLGSDIASVRARVDAARALSETTVESADARLAWDAAREAAGRDPRYAGVTIRPVSGLLPIGTDPSTGLLEFAHLHSGTPAQRDADGALVRDPANGIVLVLLPGGTFWMGASAEGAVNVDPMAESINEDPVHEVQLAPFLIGKYEMTQAQWRRVTGANPSVHHASSIYVEDDLADLHPVESVGWFEARTVLRKLGLGLPSEAQWEYAARAGTGSPWYAGTSLGDLLDPPAGNLADERSAVTLGVQGWTPTPGLEDGFVMHAPIGSFEPNGFGLFDVIGNVNEWCEDAYVSYARPPGVGDGRRPMPESPKTVMYRGGAFDQPAQEARSANRAGAPPTRRLFSIGVRAAVLLRQ